MDGKRAERRRAEIEWLDQPEHLADGDGAGGGGRRAAHLEAAIRDADRIAQLGAVGCEVFGRERAGPARIVLHGLGDVLGDGACVEGRRAGLGDGIEGLGEFGALELIAPRPGPSGGVEEKRACFGRESRGVGLGEQACQPRRDLEPVPRQRDGRSEQIGPRELPVFLMRERERRDHTGGADRASAGGGNPLGERLAVRAEEQLRRGAGRRGLATVEIEERLGGRVEGEQEGAAADAGGLRLDHVERHLRGDGRIDGAASLPQDGEAGLGGERVGRHHHLPLRRDEGLGACQIARALGLLVGERAGAKSQQRRNGHDKER